MDNFGLDKNLPCSIEKTLCDCGGIKGIIETIPDKDKISEMSGLFSAGSDPIRMTILEMLKVHKLCVCIIKQVLEIPDSKLSYHLKILQNSGLITGEAHGTWIIYRLTDKGEIFMDSLSGFKKIKDVDKNI
ncbi:ArsR/SmtB family transcription factor [Methanoplanus endosymbiosus]|uniref:Metalloregulator ArsR/SmtB family transcription factor n=1 Tax=Methanoplanus endosymbiosus TaxID=33865 RepID=A0A9E7THV9_9EURY|nr:metalloregulator ArsR/SmtB family transcription factor [Methanoplanus endosymbiosus]UUX91318.1 metalloregulator ArsR/SmtB family transcription factor [Methanoplanus endosymbiosus]